MTISAAQATRVARREISDTLKRDASHAFNTLDSIYVDDSRDYVRAHYAQHVDVHVDD